ncbi:MAG: radical SAM protein, partial [Firmicutes bacterium]|nr:radical SAM protein [Bacillota bacterium]
FCKELQKASLDSVQITFYSNNEEIHNKLVGAPGFNDTVSGIKNALAAGLSVSINTPLCTLNRDYIKTLAYLRDKGVIYVTCSGMIMTGNAVTEVSESMQLTGAELEEILREAVKFCHENGMEIAFTSPGWIDQKVFDELNIPAPSCGACLSNMAITPAGNVVPCQSWLSGKPLGNMLRDDWENIWNCPDCTEHRNFSAEMTGECPLRRCC